MARQRSRTTSLARLLDAARLPMYAVDSQRRIVYVNPALAEWIGCDLDALIGRRCDYSSEPQDDPLDQLASSLCPPPQALAGEPLQIGLSVAHADGAAREGLAEFRPLLGRSEPAGVLVVIDPATRGAVTDDELNAAELHERLKQLRREIGRDFGLQRLVGESPAMARVRAQVELAIASPARVLISGPSGSGREHVARTIHQGRIAGTLAAPLTPLDCRLLDAELLEATVTASLRHATRQNAPDAGTLLLLNIDHLAADAQAVLLGVLSIREFQLRCLTTASCSLHELAAAGKFRWELAYALSTLSIELPALADRPDDLPLLCQVFLELENRGARRQLGGFSPEALDRLVGYSWPGNLDELAEVVRAGCQWAEGPLVEVADLPEVLELAAAAGRPPRNPQPIVLDDVLLEFETELIRRAMRLAKGNKTKAAELLGIHRARLHRRLEQLDGGQPQSGAD